MKRLVASFPLVVVMLLFGGCSTTNVLPNLPNEQSPGSGFTLDELLGRLPARDPMEVRWINRALLQGGPESVLEICRRLGPAGTAIDTASAYALNGLAIFVCRPGGEADRLLFVGALGRALALPLPPERAAFLIGRLQIAGRAESVIPLSRFLGDERLCDPATQALLAVGMASEDVLLAALPASTGGRRVTITHALGELRSSRAVGALSADTVSTDILLRTTALNAIAKIRLPGSVPVPAKAAKPDSLHGSPAPAIEPMPDPEKRSVDIIRQLQTANGEPRLKLLRALGRVGGRAALEVVSREVRSKDEDLRDAAIRALTDWPDMGAFDTLLVVAKGKEKLNLRVVALRGCVRMTESSLLNSQTQLRYLERTLEAAERIEEKRLVLGALGNLRNREALRLVIPSIDDDSLGLDAAMAAWKISTPAEERRNELGSADVARTFIESRLQPQFRVQAARAFDARGDANEPPDNFSALFNGKDLAGWKGLVETPVIRATMDSVKLATAQARADSSMRTHWAVADGVLVFDGKGESLCTIKDYGDFELLVDWKIEKNGDSGIYLRGSPQVQIWDPAQWPEGSGGLYNNQKGRSKPLLRADNPIGEWNRFRILMVHDRVTVYLNDVLVVDSVALENYWDRSLPIFPTGQIELQSHSSPLHFRNIFIREIPRQRPLFAGSLFNGSDLKGFTVIDGKEESWKVANGILATTGEGGGWLSTAGEYGNFQLDLDFRLSEGGNSGVFIRSPRQGDPAYTGMEIQLLDDSAPVYAKLKPWQYTGSIYGVQPPALRASKKHGEWQHMQIVADGPRVVVRLNEQMIVDADLIAHMDQERAHPGLKRRSGFIGLQSHTSLVEYRNITIRELR